MVAWPGCNLGFFLAHIFILDWWPLTDNGLIAHCTVFTTKSATDDDTQASLGLLIRFLWANLEIKHVIQAGFHSCSLTKET